MSYYQLSRRESREAITIYLYQYLIFKSINDKNYTIELFMSSQSQYVNIMFQNIFKADRAFNILEDELFVTTLQQCNKIELISSNLNSHLSNEWRFDRLAFLEQAILILSYIQIMYLNIEKQVVINEAIELSRKYCDEESYRYINQVLDKIK